MPRRSQLLAALVMLVWGGNFVVIDVALDHTTPLLLVVLRFALVALAVPFVPRPGVGARWVLLVGLFMSCGQFALLFTAMELGMPAGLASLVLQMQTVFTVLLAVGLLGERLSPVQVAAIVIAFAGIAVIAGGRAEGVPLGALALSVAAGLSWAAGNVCTKLARPTRPFSLMVYAALVPPLPVLGLSAAVEGAPQVDASWALLGALAYLVVLATFLGYGIWATLLSRHPASQVAPWTLLVPPIGIASAWLALGERPNGAEIGGAVLVLIGLALNAGLLGADRLDHLRRLRHPEGVRRAGRDRVGVPGVELD